MAFRTTDLILVHRDGQDWQAEVGPLMGGGGLSDAPTDGKAYIRKDAGWTVIERTPHNSPVKGLNFTQKSSISDVGGTNAYLTNNKLYLDISYATHQVFSLANYAYLTINGCRLQVSRKQTDDPAAPGLFVVSHYGYCGGSSNVPTAGASMNMFNDATPTPTRDETYRSFPEAPNDGRQYVRANGIWEQVSIDPDASFPEAPDSGEIYGRNGKTKVWERALPYDLTNLPRL